MTIGEELKASREAKGLSLTEIAEKTRISHTFLKALEEDDYSVIPGDVFVVGFLRTYSKELGLDVKDIMARYKDINPPKEAETPPQEAKPQQHHPKPSLISISHGRQPVEKANGKKNPIYLIIIGGILLGAAITGIMLLLTPRFKPLEVQSPPQAPVARKAPAPTLPKPPRAAPLNTTSFKPHTTVSPQARKPVQQAGPLILKLFASADSYYSYRADKSKKINGILKKGMTLEVKADNEIVLTLGNAGGVTADFNGRKMGPFGKRAQVVRDLVFK